MSYTIETDERGSLIVPAGLLGGVAPGARFSVEPHGDFVILRREQGEADRWWASTTPAERVAWLEDWIRSLPPGPALPPEAARRDSMYE